MEWLVLGMMEQKSQTTVEIGMPTLRRKEGGFEHCIKLYWMKSNERVQDAYVMQCKQQASRETPIGHLKKTHQLTEAPPGGDVVSLSKRRDSNVLPAKPRLRFMGFEKKLGALLPPQRAYTSLCKIQGVKAMKKYACHCWCVMSTSVLSVLAKECPPIQLMAVSAHVPRPAPVGVRLFLTVYRLYCPCTKKRAINKPRSLAHRPTGRKCCKR